MYMGSKSLLNMLLEAERIFGKSEKLTKAIHDEKIGLRNAYREHERYDDGWRWHYTDYDSMYGKRVFDGEWTDAEIHEFIEDEWCHWYNPYEDGRDCTGVWFTRNIQCFRVPGKTIVYHFKSCDV